MIRNVLEHVAAANPEPPNADLSEHEQTERDAIRAMVLASELPAPAVTHPRRRRRRRATVALGAVAACAAIVVGVTAAGRDTSFVDRAYAAMTASGLFHVLEEGSIDAPLIVFEHEPYEGLEARRTRMEAWYDRGDQTSHFIVFARRDGRWVRDIETAWKDGKSFARWGPDGSISDAQLDDGDGQLDDLSTPEDESQASTEPTDYYAVSLFEDAYRKDKVRDHGEVTIDGRRYRRLVLDIPPLEGAPGPRIGTAKQVMLFDPETLYPIQLTLTFPITIDGADYPVKMTTHYRTFERLPETPENRAKLDVR